MTLCVSAPGVLSLVQLQESGPGLVRPSKTLSLTYTVSGHSISSGSWWSWIREPTGKGLQWVEEIYKDGDTNYNPFHKSPVTMTVDTAKNQFTLKLSSVTTKDIAMYYCARYTVRGFQCETRHKPTCRAQKACTERGVQSPPSPYSHPRSRCRRKKPRPSCLVQWFSLCFNIPASPGMNFSLNFHIFSHILTLAVSRVTFSI
jgi:hypothetical protein